jgi:hypothetical protein
VIKEEKSAAVFSIEVNDREYGEKAKKMGDIFDVHFVEREIVRTTQEGVYVYLYPSPGGRRADRHAE